MNRTPLVATGVVSALLALAACDDAKKQQPAAAKPVKKFCVKVIDRTRDHSAQIVDTCTGQSWFYNTTTL